LQLSATRYGRAVDWKVCVSAFASLERHPVAFSVSDVKAKKQGFPVKLEPRNLGFGFGRFQQATTGL